MPEFALALPRRTFLLAESLASVSYLKHASTPFAVSELLFTRYESSECVVGSPYQTSWIVGEPKVPGISELSIIVHKAARRDECGRAVRHSSGDEFRKLNTSVLYEFDVVVW